MGKSLVVLSVLFALGGCQGLDRFRGTWEGSIDSSPDVREGFGEGTELTLEIHDLDERQIHASITTCVRGFDEDRCSPGRFQQTPLVMLEKARNDSLGSMQFGGEPYAVYVTTAKPADPAEAEVLAIVSLHSQDRVEVRLLRGSELYGVFRLTQTREEGK